jgi:hypothetical protein
MPQLNTTALAGAVGRWLSDNFVPQFTTSRALFEFLRTKDRIRFGGAYLVAPVFGTRSSAAGGITNFYASLTFPNDQGVAAEYTWSWYHDIAAINPNEELVAGSKEDMANIVESKLQQAINSISEAINSDIWTTTVGSQSKVNGLPYIVSNTGTLGGLDPATYTWWVGQLNTTATTLSLSAVNRAINSVLATGGKPDLICMTPDLYAAFENLIFPAQIIPDAALAKAGFQAIVYRGCTVLFDAPVPANNLVVLSSRDLHLAMSDRSPRPEPIPAGITPSKGYYLKVGVQLCTTRRRSHFRYSNIS